MKDDGPNTGARTIKIWGIAVSISFGRFLKYFRTENVPAHQKAYGRSTCRHGLMSNPLNIGMSLCFTSHTYEKKTWELQE